MTWICLRSLLYRSMVKDESLLVVPKIKYFHFSFQYYVIVIKFKFVKTFSVYVYGVLLFMFYIGYVGKKYINVYHAQ